MNFFALIATIIFGINMLEREYAFLLLIFLVLGFYGTIVALFGYVGLRITYYFGCISFLWYFVVLWKSLGSTTGISTFILTLYLYPFLLPPFPILGCFVCIIVDWIIIAAMKRKNKMRHKT
jgi:hypothetical protein